MGDNGKENGNYRDYWGYIGVMEKKMETTIMGYIGYIILGHYRGPNNFGLSQGGSKVSFRKIFPL